MPTLHEIAVSLTARAGTFEAELRKSQTSVKSLETQVKSLETQMRGQAPAAKAATSGLSGLSGELKSLVAGYVGLQAAIKATTFVVGAAGSVEAQQKAWTGLTGSIGAGRKELEFVRESANKLGIGFDDLEKGYRMIAASAKGTSLEGAKSRQIFLDLSQAMTALGAPSDAVAGAMRAVSQMMSTGVVQADELRNELGNHLPGVMSIAARSMGMTTLEFRKLQEAGGVITDEFLPKFAAMVKSTFGGSGEQARTLSGEFNRMWNGISEGSARLAMDTGFFDWLKRGVSLAGDLLEAMNKVDREREKFGRERSASLLGPEGAATGTEALQKQLNEQNAIVRDAFLKREALVNKLADLMKKRAAEGRSPGDPPLGGFSQKNEVIQLNKSLAILEEQLKTAEKERDRLVQAIRPPKVGGLGDDLSLLPGADELGALSQNKLNEKTKLDDFNKQQDAILKTQEERAKISEAMGKTTLESLKDQVKLLEKAREDLLEKFKGTLPTASALTLPGALLGEMDRIQAAAKNAGVDPNFLTALRRTENGRAGREFGVLSVPAPTYDDQARIAAQTIAANLKRFQAQGQNPMGAGGQYAPEFIKFFSARYAPLGAGNDPNNMNAAHAGNLQKFYDAPVGADRLTPKIDKLKEYIATQESGYDIQKLSVEVDADRAKSIERLLDKMDPLTTKTDAHYRATELDRAAQLAAAGDFEAMDQALENVNDNIKLGTVGLNERQRAQAALTMESQLALMTDQDAAQAIRVLAEARLTEMESLERDAKATKQLHEERQKLEKQAKVLAKEEEDLAQIRAESWDMVRDLLADMKAGLPTLDAYEKALAKIIGVAGKESPTAKLAEDLRIESDPVFKAASDGIDNLVGDLEGRLASALAGNKDAFKDWGATVTAEFAHILLDALDWREKMTSLLKEVLKQLQQYLQTLGQTGAGVMTTGAGGSGSPLGGATGGTGDVITPFSGGPGPIMGGSKDRPGFQALAQEQAFLANARDVGQRRERPLITPQIARMPAPQVRIVTNESAIRAEARRSVGGGQTMVGAAASATASAQRGAEAAAPVALTLNIHGVRDTREFHQSRGQVERAMMQMLRNAHKRL